MAEVDKKAIRKVVHSFITEMSSGTILLEPVRWAGLIITS